MNEIREVEMATKTILDLVVEYREKASWTCNPYSRAVASDYVGCTDIEVASFLNELQAGVDKTNLIISDLHWIESGNCTRDELYPVRLSAVRLPDGRYFIELTGKFKTQEYILEL